MLVRSVPLALCLLWLAYESHFSPSFFVATLETGAVSIASGMEDVLIADQPADFPTVLASADGSGDQ
jgi:hypothetical protein